MSIEFASPSVYSIEDFAPKETTAVVTPKERQTDASKLSFPIQIVIAIVVSAVSASATIWAVQARADAAISQMQSDIRNVLTRMDAAADQKKLESANLDLRLQIMQKDVEQSELRKALLDRLKK